MQIACIAVSVHTIISTLLGVTDCLGRSYQQARAFLPSFFAAGLRRLHRAFVSVRHHPLVRVELPVSLNFARLLYMRLTKMVPTPMPGCESASPLPDAVFAVQISAVMLDYDGAVTDDPSHPPGIWQQREDDSNLVNQATDEEASSYEAVRQNFVEPMELVLLRDSMRNCDDESDLDTSFCSLDLMHTKVIEIGCARSWFEALYESQLDDICEHPLPGAVLEFWREKGYHATMRDGVIFLAPYTPLVPSPLDFEEAPSFQGVRSGWCFKMGPHGLGYYRDLKKQVLVELDDLKSLHRDCEVDLSSDSSVHYPISDDDGECQFIANRAYGNEFLDRKEREYRELERQELLREMMLVGEWLGPPPPLPPLPFSAAVPGRACAPGDVGQ